MGVVVQKSKQQVFLTWACSFMYIYDIANKIIKSVRSLKHASKNELKDGWDSCLNFIDK